jgi:hypothetical protein
LNLEYFYDHPRIEHMLFDGAVTPVDGLLHPDLSRPGLGLEFKRADAARYAVEETRPPITGRPSGVLAGAGAALIAGAVAWELRNRRTR